MGMVSVFLSSWLICTAQLLFTAKIPLLSFGAIVVSMLSLVRCTLGDWLVTHKLDMCSWTPGGKALSCEARQKRHEQQYVNLDKTIVDQNERLRKEGNCCNYQMQVFEWRKTKSFVWQVHNREGQQTVLPIEEVIQCCVSYSGSYLSWLILLIIFIKYYCKRETWITEIRINKSMNKYFK